jgi:hypothetical protein
MRVLALDLGTHTGWALRDSTGATTSGTWHLATEAELRLQRKGDLDRCCDCRFSRLHQRVSMCCVPDKLDWIYFEDVEFFSSRMQTQLWAGFRTVLTLLYPVIKIGAVPVGTLKKFATGKGNATKEQMALALIQRGVLYRGQEGVDKGEVEIYHCPPGCGRPPVDDNEIDALHLLELAKKELKLT